MLFSPGRTPWLSTPTHLYSLYLYRPYGSKSGNREIVAAAKHDDEPPNQSHHSCDRQPVLALQFLAKGVGNVGPDEKAEHAYRHDQSGDGWRIPQRHQDDREACRIRIEG